MTKSKGFCAGVVQPGEENALERPYSTFKYLKGTNSKRAEERFFARVYSHMKRGNGFKLKGDRFKLGIKK